MPEQLVSADPTWGGAAAGAPSVSAALPQTALPSGLTAALPNDRALIGGMLPHLGATDVSVEDMRTHPVESIQKLGAALGQDVSDPRVWVNVAAAYFGPKLLGKVLPPLVSAIGAARTNAATGTIGDTLVSAAGRKLGIDPDALDLAATRMRLQAARSKTRIAKMAADQAPTSPAETSPAPPAPAPPAATAPAAPPAQPAAPTVSPQTLKIQAQLAQAGYTRDEIQAATTWLKQGVPPAQVVERLAKTRALSGTGAFAKLPSSLEVEQAVKARNESGRWPE